MVLKEIDFLSPPITLFYQGYPSYSSCLSGFLSILSVLIIIAIIIPKILIIFDRERELPSSTLSTYFMDDVGIFPLNSSALFHFISFKDINYKEDENFPFSEFSAIGFQGSISTYKIDNNISHYDHWLYGYCNIEKDAEGLKDIISHDLMSKSACIRKYYNSKNNQYYDTNNPYFIWPNIAHGTYNPNNNFYSVIVIPCQQNILNNIFKGETCKDINEINFIQKGIHFNFIDRYIDVTKYKNPLGKYGLRLENKLDKDNYSINHMNFNPSLIKSKSGLILDNVKKEYSYLYDRTDVFSYKREDNIYIGYSIYLNNRINYYEREYSSMLDILSDIGGILNIIIFIMSFINEFINSYIILKDFILLLNLFSITEKDIARINKKNIMNKKLNIIETYKKNNCRFTREKTPEFKKENGKITEKKDETEEKGEIEKKEDKKDKKETPDTFTITSQSMETEKSDDKSAIAKDNQEIDKEKEKDDSEKKNVCFSFYVYLLYKITFGKKNEHLKLFEDFRKKVLGVENLTENYLNLNKLIRSKKKFSKIYKS